MGIYLINVNNAIMFTSIRAYVLDNLKRPDYYEDDIPFMNDIENITKYGKDMSCVSLSWLDTIHSQVRLMKINPLQKYIDNATTLIYDKDINEHEKCYYYDTVSSKKRLVVNILNFEKIIFEEGIVTHQHIRYIVNRSKNIKHVVLNYYVDISSLVNVIISNQLEILELKGQYHFVGIDELIKIFKDVNILYICAHFAIDSEGWAIFIESMKIKKLKKLIVDGSIDVYDDSTVYNTNLVKSKGLIYYVPNMIMRYRTLYLSHRANKKYDNNVFVWLCCMAPFWTVRMVCLLLCDEMENFIKIENVDTLLHSI